MAHFRTIESKKKGVSSLGDMIGDDLGKYLNMKPTSDEYAHKGDRQVNKIYAILKWKFKWDKKHMFNYITNIYPGLLKKLDAGERNHYNMTAIFLSLTKKEKGLLIKRIEAMEARYTRIADRKGIPINEIAQGRGATLQGIELTESKIDEPLKEWEEMIK
jgi:hypothetical protein